MAVYSELMLTNRKIKKINALNCSRVFWDEWLYKPFNVGYTVHFTYILKGKIDLNIFNKTIKIFTDNNTVFKSYFSEEQEILYQYFDLEYQYRLQYKDFTKTDKTESIRETLNKVVNTPFDLRRTPNARFYLYKLKENTYIFLFTCHHILIDGKCINFILDQIEKIYNNELQPESDYKQLSEFIERENIKNNKKKRKDIEYWKKAFSQTDFNEPISFIKKQSAININTLENISISKISINKELLEKTLCYCNKNNYSINQLLLAIWYIVISKYTCKENISVFIPTNNLEKINKKFILNTVSGIPFIFNIDKQCSFEELLGKISKKLLFSLIHNHLSIKEVLANIDNNFEDINNIFNIGFAESETRARRLDLNNIKSSSSLYLGNIGHCDINVEYQKQNDKIEILFHYKNNIFSKYYINEIAEKYKEILDLAVKNSTKKISEIIILSKNKNDLNYYKQQNYLIDKKILYWKNKLRFYKNTSILTDFVTEKKTDKVGYYETNLNDNLVCKLEKYSLEVNISLHIILLSIFIILLSLYNDDEDITIGTVSSEKNNDNKINFQLVNYINTVLLRINLKNRNSFFKIIEYVNKEYKNTIKYFLPIEKLNNILQKKQKDNLVSTIFTYQNLNNNNKFDISKYYNKNLTFNIRKEFRNTKVIVQYSVDLYETQTIEKVCCYYIKYLEELLLNPHNNINSIGISKSTLNKHQKIDLINTTLNKYFEKISKYNKTAIVYKKKQIKYNELNNASNQLAVSLRYEYKNHWKQNLKKKDYIGIFMARSYNMILAMLSILKTGAAYVIFDTSDPKERLKYKINNCCCKMIITDNENIEKLLFLHEFDSLLLNLTTYKIYLKNSSNNIKSNNKPNDPACMIYTSGSTGKPKGVVINHQAILNLTLKNQYIDLKKENLIHLASPAFDAAIFEIWGALLNIAELIIPDSIDFIGDETAFYKEIVNKKISVLWLTSSLFNYLFERNNYIFDTLKYLIIGGEVVSRNNINKLVKLPKNKRPIKIFNGYGPTECTVFTTMYEIKSFQKRSIPIGTPINNYFLYILNNKGKQVFPGMIGELCVAGIGLSPKYYKNKYSTNKNFIKNPYSEDIFLNKIYKTGDYVRELNDGNIEYIGRKDNQIKLNGNRIELEEINRFILMDKKIKDCYTVVEEEYNRKLVCYYISDRNINSEDFIEKLINYLPTYMIPTKYKRIDKKPLNVNGKLIIRKDLHAQRTIIEPKNNLQREFVLIIKNILNIKEVSITDDFFKIGGDSIKVLNFVNEVYKKHKIQLAASDVFQLRTIEKMTNKRVDNYIEKIPQVDNIKTSPYQYNLFIYEKLHDWTNHYNIPIILELKPFVKNDIFRKIIKEIVKKNEIFNFKYLISNKHCLKQNLIITKIKINNVIVNNKKELEHYLINICSYKFNLEKERPLKLINIFCQKERYIVFLIHHIVFDEWSLDLLKNQLEKGYYSLINKEISKSYVKYQYSDFLKFIKKNNIQQLKYWKNNLNISETFKINGDKNGIFKYEGKDLYLSINKKETEFIENYAKEKGFTLYILLGALFAIFLKSLTEKKNVVFYSPFTLRNRPEFNNIIGYFVNTLPINITINENKSVEKFIYNYSDKLLSIQNHKECPLNEIISSQIIPRNYEENPISEILFSYQRSSTDINSKLFKAIDASRYYNIAKYHISFYVYKANEKINIKINYNKSLYSTKFIKDIAVVYRNMLLKFLQQLNQKVKDFIFEMHVTKVNFIKKISDNKENINYLNERTTKAIEKIWIELLDNKSSKKTDSFFDAGGDSLLAIQLVNKIKKQFNIRFNIIDLFNNPTIEKISDFISNYGKNSSNRN